MVAHRNWDAQSRISHILEALRFTMNEIHKS